MGARQETYTLPMNGGRLQTPAGQSGYCLKLSRDRRGQLLQTPPKKAMIKANTQGSLHMEHLEQAVAADPPRGGGGGISGGTQTPCGLTSTGNEQTQSRADLLRIGDPPPQRDSQSPPSGSINCQEVHRPLKVPVPEFGPAWCGRTRSVPTRFLGDHDEQESDEDENRRWF